ncbi:MAG: rhomboid family intramembrane serine protease [Oscillospiraceae bacterium]|nr:rhomboid family intramembrane serine protease [Oscillospiraceae bacterium]
MKKTTFRLQYNSPAVLSFSLAALAALLLGYVTRGRATALFFSVYRSPLTDLLTYPRFFLHVLGHQNFEHFIGNIMLILVVGPPMEEKYGSRSLIWAIAVTALVSGLVNWLFFPGTALLGASGIVFMLIVMSSLSGMKDGCIPVTLILVLLLYLGREVVNGITLSDNVSQLTHIVGGLCGAFLGLSLRRQG